MLNDFRNEIRRNDYFKQLRKSYSETHFYITAVNDCSYLRDFLTITETNHRNNKR